MTHKRREYLPEFEPPKKKVISDKDLIIKKLYNEQQCTEFQPQREKVFISSSEIVPLTNVHSGQCSSQQLQAISDCMLEIEQYKAAGLNNQEIQLYIDSQNGLDYIRKKHKNYQAELLVEHLDKIRHIVKEFRDKQDEETVTENMKNEELYQPMDHIKMINDTYKNEDQISVLKINKIRKKIRTLENKIKNLPEMDNNIVSISAPKTQWDMKEPVKVATVEKKTYSCKPEKLYTIVDGKITPLNSVHPIATKLSEEEIKSCIHFKNYEAGTPNKVLFIKNLHNKVKEIDLQHIFRDYSNFSVKIMNGKMRGQAFVTFTDEPTAFSALNTCNGTILYGKAIVIHFGKKK